MANNLNIDSERRDFEAWMKTCQGWPFAGAFSNLMWAAWQARGSTINNNRNKS